MPSEIHLAFAHPSERAAATAVDQPLDRISVRDHIVEVEIGAFQAERGTTQRVAFNVVVEVRPAGAPVEDDVDRILSYDRITEAIETELADERLNLLETLAERIALRVLAEPRAMRVFVRIEKLDRGPGALGVEIVRTKGATTVASPQDVPHPSIVYLSNDAIAAPRLVGWLDQLQARGRPVILCVGSSDMPTPNTGHAPTQRRIDLLAIEQNAWVLAALDPRCVVVNTRTELDWAMKHDQISVWAPSKLVLDSVDGPEGSRVNARDLAVWLALGFDARDMLFIGEAPPVDPGVPVRTIAATDPKVG